MTNKYIIQTIVTLCAAVVMVCCNKPDIPTPDGHRITASIDGTTRVSFDEHRVTWYQYDVIGFARLEDGKFCADEGYIYYKIDPETISPNGTMAQFIPYFAGKYLSDEATYIAFSGGESYDESEDYINIFGFSNWQYGNGSTLHIGDHWMMASKPFTYNKEEETMNIHFRHLTSIVSLTLSLDEGVEGEYAIDQVRLSSPINSFGNDINVSPSGEVSSYNRNFDSYYLEVSDTASHATISANRSYTANFQVWWDPAYTDVEGDFRVSIRTTDGAISHTSFPARGLSAATFYTKECRFAAPKTNDAAQRDRATLCSLYAALDGDNWKERRNWMSDLPISKWHGVKCDEMTGEVVELSLRYNGLKAASLPTQIGDLKALRYLDLAQNDIGGDIPQSIGQLTQLQELRLYQNSLTGAIPSEIGKLRNLEVLYLHSNKIDVLPSTIGDMDYLTELNLYRNDITELPHELGDMRSIKTINISYNSINDTIPESLCKLATLEELDLSNNQLQESLPADIGNMAKLSNLDLGYNNLKGTLPPSMANLPSEARVSLINNQLSGVVSREVVAHPNFRSWALNNNAGLTDEDGEYLLN